MARWSWKIKKIKGAQMLVSYAWKLISRNLRRTATYLFGLALAVGLFAGILFFVDVTTRQMTATALAPVQIDLIAHATSADVNMTDVVASYATQRGISTVEPVTTADFLSATKVGGTQTSPTGRMFAIAPSYLQTFDILRLSEGKIDPNGVLISEAMAIAQNLNIGDRVQFTFAGIDKAITLPVTGIINMDNSDALFTTATENENAMVADVAFVDIQWFRTNLETKLAALTANPPSNLPTGAILLDQQMHIKIDRSLLHSDPTKAAVQTDSLRRQLERQFPGQIKVVDNLSGAFKNANADVLSAKILFIFLGLPGVALAAYLAKFAAELFADAQRREISLLRTRGASPRQIASILAASSFFLAIGGSILGLVFGLLILVISAGAQATSGINPFSVGFDWAMFANSAGIALIAGLVLTFLAAFLPTFGTLHSEITQERRTVRRMEQAPFWKRAYLDVLLLVAAAVVLIVTQLNGGFKPTGNEGAAISLSFYVFLAPFFAWIGLTLLTLRLVEGGLTAAARPLASFFSWLFGEIGEIAGKSISRRTARISAATTVIALTLSFGISLALFQQTYTHEKQLDSQYIVGSDLRLTPALNTPQLPDFTSKLQIPGVTGVTAVARDPQALIGSEKNTVYGIDVTSFKQVAYLPDSFFVDGSAQKTMDAMRNRTTNYASGSARQVLDALANTPNGVIISVEQAEKYNILVGDPLLMRLYNRTSKQYTDVKAICVGLFTYFPTSAQDSDFILNRDFMTTSSGNPAMDYFLLKTDGTSASVTNVTNALTIQYKNVMPIRIQSTETVIKVDQSSLTSMNLGGLGAMERFYNLLVVSVGLAIFLLAMINERQREFGAMRALGANLKQLRRFIFAEAATIGGLSFIIGGIIGVGLARLLVMLLGVVFTIPATGLSWPIVELASMSGLVLVGMLVSTLLSTQRLSRIKVVEALREL
jgi:putative ABC transport system permease protein